jgi:hypothetical protein
VEAAETLETLLRNHDSSRSFRFAVVPRAIN